MIKRLVDVLLAGIVDVAPPELAVLRTAARVITTRGRRTQLFYDLVPWTVEQAKRRYGASGSENPRLEPSGGGRRAHG